MSTSASPRTYATAPKLPARFAQAPLVPVEQAWQLLNQPPYSRDLTYFQVQLACNRYRLRMEGRESERAAPSPDRLPKTEEDRLPRSDELACVWLRGAYRVRGYLVVNHPANFESFVVRRKPRVGRPRALKKQHEGLKRELVRLEASQIELAQAAGLDQSIISRIIHGRVRMPNIETRDRINAGLEALAKAHGKSRPRFNHIWRESGQIWEAPAAE